MPAAQAGCYAGRDVFIEEQLERANASPLSGDEHKGLGQHSLEGRAVHGIVFGNGAVDLFRKCLRIIGGGLHSGLGPTEMFGYGVEFAFVAVDEEHDLPDGEAASLHTGLAAGGRVAEVDEGEFGAAQALLDQAGAGVAWGPPMAGGEAL